MSLAILFHFLCAQHVSDINISIIRSLRLFCFGVVGLELYPCCRFQHGYHSKPTTPKLQHTSNQEQYDQCGNSTEKSQAPDDGYINVRNMLST